MCNKILGRFRRARGTSNIDGPTYSTETICLGGASRYLDCAGRAKRRRRFPTREPGDAFFQSGVALRLPPQSKFADRVAEQVYSSTTPCCSQLSNKAHPTPNIQRETAGGGRRVLVWQRNGIHVWRKFYAFCGRQAMAGMGLSFIKIHLALFA